MEVEKEEEEGNESKRFEMIVKKRSVSWKQECEKSEVENGM